MNNYSVVSGPSVKFEQNGCEIAVRFKSNWNNGPICLLGATEQLPISHLFIQSTALFAVSNTCILR